MITAEQAIEIAKKHHGAECEFYSVTHGMSQISPCLEYITNARKWRPDDVWCVLCARAIIASSRAIIISKETGEVLYDGSAGDEG